MTDALLADLRALADQADEAVALDAIHDWERGWRQAHRKNARDLRDLLAKHTPEPDVSERDELARAAEWVAEAVGYPVHMSMPDAPMPDGLWEALVDHVHADKSGRWHGNELDRDEVAAWLAEEAGRKR